MLLVHMNLKMLNLNLHKDLITCGNFCLFNRLIG